MSGITDMLVPFILHREDAYTYDIAKKINVLSGGSLDISLNILYTVIYKLEEEGYISQNVVKAGKRCTRVYYHLEPLGYEYSESLYNEYIKLNDAVRIALDGINLKEAGTDE